jgi:hypothetical protein
MRPAYDSANRWNLQHPPGTAVVVTLADGRTFEDRTAGYAMQWGSVALVTLQERPGMWSTAMLARVREPSCSTSSCGK